MLIIEKRGCLTHRHTLIINAIIILQLACCRSSFQLLKAYAEGDGVEADKSQARKWLLAAHGSGMAAAREEIANLP